MIPESDFSQAKFLIIDDDEVSTNLIADLLEKDGYKNITVTNDPKKACVLYQEILPDLIVLDLNMPGMDGFDVMVQLQKIQGETYLPIIVISNEENRIRTKSCGG